MRVPTELGDHAILDRCSRELKGRKIRDLLTRHRTLRNLKILDVGTGTGHAAAVLIEAVGPAGEVCAVDRVNQLCVSNILFRETPTTDIPFEDDRFDIVITNHVIEHVGDRRAQLHHLKEIKRVLRPNGLIYLAVPNRWSVWEHHFDLPFLGWLPERLAHLYVRVTSKGTHYDCRPLSLGQLKRLFVDAGLDLENLTEDALRYMAEHEMSGLAQRVIKFIPPGLSMMLMGAMPTIVVLGRPQ